ncbi:hypothetical protein NDU88_005180 [Pleurodeles waltl]|uniref:Uncharacterized protein n=1 Tax=Pleurodeles waltl TaxID=8319 RepID=A0AAV7UHE0_PLEWA|nr:hypothetical protein NDU88_005180 [Pleurodeles waltl]
MGDAARSPNPHLATGPAAGPSKAQGRPPPITSMHFRPSHRPLGPSRLCWSPQGCRGPEGPPPRTGAVEQRAPPNRLCHRCGRPPLQHDLLGPSCHLTCGPREVRDHRLSSAGTKQSDPAVPELSACRPTAGGGSLLPQVPQDLLRISPIAGAH